MGSGLLLSVFIVIMIPDDIAMGSGLLLSVFIVIMIPDDIAHRCIMDTKKIGNLFQGISVLDAGIIDSVVSFLLLLYVVRKEVF